MTSKGLKFEHQLLGHLFQKLQQERDELKKQLTKATLEVQEKGGLNNMLLDASKTAVKELQEESARTREVGPSESTLMLEFTEMSEIY